MIGVRLEADLSTQGCANGKLGGGVTVEEFRGKLLPAIANGLNQVITADQDAANTLLPVFDSDNNGTITVQELENNPLLMLAISPDLDLLDASGKFSPGQNGVNDSYSAGLGFTCVPVIFNMPEDQVRFRRAVHYLTVSPPSGGGQHSPADGCGWGEVIVR